MITTIRGAGKTEMRRLFARVVVASLMLAIAACILVAKPSSASGETVTGSDTFSGLKNTAIPISDVQVSGSGNPTVPVRLFVSNGTLAMGTTTGLTFTGSSTGSKLEFSGSLANVNAALATLTYTRSSIGSDTLEVSLVDAGQVFFPDNGHLYEYVSSTLTWGNAKTAAEGRTKYGAQGYLVTITSASENQFVADRLTNAGWMGASDAAVEGAWRWVTGPENGTQFWSGAASGSAVGGRYQNWNTGEPNDSGANEDCGQFLAGSTGLWNDLPCSGTTLPGYVVEYGTDSTPPAVASLEATIYTLQNPNLTKPASSSSHSSVDVDTTLYSAPQANSVQLIFTGTTTRTLTLTGVNSGNTQFTFDPTNPTASANVAAADGAIPDGTYDVSIQYIDSASGATLTKSVASVLIDATAPTIPGTPSTSSPTNDTTPTFTWAASTDEGTGLHATPYVIQWSQDPDFGGFITTSTSATSYTISSALSEGTWYFRARARDAVLNYSDFSANGSVVIDTTPPSVDATTPANAATAVLRGASIEIELDEAVSKGTGELTIHRLSDDSVVESIDVTSENVSIEDSTITVELSTSLDFSTQYYVLVDAGTFIDTADNDFAGINSSATWSFTTEGTDYDNDGIPSLVEEAGPNNGDANDDGTPDAQQANVASMLNPINGQYVVLAVNDDCSITALTMITESSSSTDASYDYPAGLMDFALNCSEPGATAVVTQYYYGIEGDFAVRKLNTDTKTYRTIQTAAIAEQTIGGQQVMAARYEVADGGELDQDVSVNGSIIDPAGLGQAVAISTLSGTGQAASRYLVIAVLILIPAVITIVVLSRQATKRK